MFRLGIIEHDIWILNERVFGNGGNSMIRITIRNPNTGTTETIGQEEFNRYMSMTNGEVLNWIVDEKPTSPPPLEN